jgi:hypothetical protein
VCACVGDCDLNAETTLDELITLVNVALGNSTVSACRLGDVNGDGAISVDEILQAVNTALYGCSGTLPTPTATSPAPGKPLYLASWTPTWKWSYVIEWPWRDLNAHPG